MKHPKAITIFLVFLFLVSQVFGLFLIEKEMSVDNGKISFGETAVGERPDVQGLDSFLFIALAVVFATLLFLLIVKFRKAGIWKAWYFVAVWFAVTISMGVFFEQKTAYAVGFILAVLKLSYRNFILYNATEILMYGGIGLLLSPLFDVRWAVVLLVAISLYDMYAVWKSKHMVEMAKFQASQNIFAGLMVPYGKAKAVKKVKKGEKGVPVAILGGGDIVFPLIFSGAVLSFLVGKGFEKMLAFQYALIVTLFATIALSLLFFFSEKKKFYPAMPFLSAGCFAGLLVVLLMT